MIVKIDNYIRERYVCHANHIIASGRYIEFISLHFIIRNILAIEIARAYIHQAQSINLGETIWSFY